VVRGVAVCAGLLMMLASCAKEPVTIEHTEPSLQDTTRCEELVAALPDLVSGAKRRLVSPAASLGAAWGDPPIVLTCGGDWPLPAAAFCTEANGVDWYIPDDATNDLSAAVVLTTIGRTPAVRVELPSKYLPPAATMVALAPAINKTLVASAPCE
jgi:hypothetical protein